jgi:acyl dehydratase
VNDFPVAGEEIPPLFAPQVSEGKLAEFAVASGDDNPIHLDPAVAIAAGHEHVIAHGMLAMAYLGRFVGDWAARERIRSLQARFVAPIPLGSVPTCAGRVLKVTDGDGERLVRLALTVKIEDGTTAVRGEAVVAFPPSAPSGTQ